MLLKELLKAIRPVEVAGDSDIEITGVNIDSRLVEAGQLFMAMRGTQADGHAYIPAAIAKGATAILCEDMPEEPVAGITYIQVKDSEDAVGKIATTFYGDPTSKMELVGVTGTNGKTTIATLLYNTFRYFGYKVGLISTVCNYIDDEPIPTEHTTPDPITLNRLLGRMADEGCKYVFMEVSSHSIAQKRISGLKYAGGIFTNLTRDHLDYHKTVENYLKAKKKFFDDLPKSAFSLTNLDDKNGLVMTQNTRSKVYTYSLRSLCDFKGRVLESHFEGMLLDFNNHELAVQFIGKFNASNLLAVFGAAVLLGKKEEEVLVALSTLHPVAGRFDAVRSPQGVTAIVDYAHTPDALINVLNAIHGVLEGKGKVITVVGAGGNRDKGKRPIMAKEAAKASDRVIITSDNPRFEEPQDIINDMLAGLDAEDMKKVFARLLQSDAITPAMKGAQELFILMFLLRGLPFVDLAYLRKSDLRGNVISYRRRKTGRPLSVTLTTEAMFLLQKYMNREEQSPYLFPILHSDEGSPKAYREYQLALRNFNYQLELLGKALGLKDRLSSYTARHTWATTAYYCEIHPGIISEAMGHSSITVTETYLKPFRSKKIDEANKQVLDFVKRSVVGVIA